MQTVFPLASIEQVLVMIKLQMGVSNVPALTGTVEANDLTWQLFESYGLGLSLSLALTEIDGVTYAVILQDPEAEGGRFYSDVFLPTVEAFVPRP